jgi:(heptosyl)LPS beta-1,4-glucosyltransferase
MKKGISLIIHTKNEEGNIKECIESAQDISDEVIVADMKSSDKTASIARKMKARVFEVKDYGFADPARNFAISKAEYEWVLQLDADERIGKPLRSKIKKITKENKYDVVKFPRKNIIFGKWIKHTGWWPDYQIRLAKKTNIDWTDKVHTPPEYKGKMLKLTSKLVNAIVHYNHPNTDSMLDKIKRYTKFERNLFEREPNITPKYMLDYFEGEFKSRYFENYGFKDGLHGFVLSKLREYYRFIEFVRYWETKNYNDLFNETKLYRYVEEHYKRYSEPTELETTRHELDEVGGELARIKSSRGYKVLRRLYQLRDKIKEKL